MFLNICNCLLAMYRVFYRGIYGSSRKIPFIGRLVVDTVQYLDDIMYLQYLGIYFV